MGVMERPSTARNIGYGLVALLIGVGVYLLLGYWRKPAPADAPQAAPADSAKTEVKPTNEKAEDYKDEPIADRSPEEEAEILGMKMVEFDEAKELVEYVMKELNQVDSARDLDQLAKLLGNGKVNPAELQMLQNLFAQDRLRLRNDQPVSLIGELVAGKKSRWMLHLADGSELQLDLDKNRAGKWKVSKVKLPESYLDADGKPLPPEQIKKLQRDHVVMDPMNFSHEFLTSLVGQKFETARAMVNHEKISDAKIAGLCILFEEGNYQLSKKKPLQVIRFKDKHAIFYANLSSATAGDDSTKAQFSITCSRPEVTQPWRIDELNLDRLLEDYAKRVAGGDVYYSPLIKNPNGGDTIVIYFEFDSNGITERTKKQLKIVASILKFDANKKITLSGHTDSKGSRDYNLGLSKKRAIAVKAYLMEQGIKEEQIVIEAHGFLQPRRREVKADGSDDPSARRANRRTEIYLDF